MWILMQSVGEIATLFPVHGGFVEVSFVVPGALKYPSNIPI